VQIPPSPKQGQATDEEPAGLGWLTPNWPSSIQTIRRFCLQQDLGLVPAGGGGLCVSGGVP